MGKRSPSKKRSTQSRRPSVSKYRQKKGFWAILQQFFRQRWGLFITYLSRLWNLVSDWFDRVIPFPRKERVDPPQTFLRGLGNLGNLEKISNAELLALFPWQPPSSLGNRVNPPDGLPAPTAGEEIHWEQVSQTLKPTVNPFDRTLARSHKISVPIKPFLLGLEDFHNLENLFTQDLLQLVDWRIQAPLSETASEEDLSLLGDILTSFPDD